MDFFLILGVSQMRVGLQRLLPKKAEIIAPFEREWIFMEHIDALGAVELGTFGVGQGCRVTSCRVQFALGTGHQPAERAEPVLVVDMRFVSPVHEDVGGGVVQVAIWKHASLGKTACLPFRHSLLIKMH